MGFYDTHVLPRLVEFACGNAGLDRWRSAALEGISGRVLEIGFGSGLNVPLYPAGITEILAVEPSERARSMAEPRVAKSSVAVRHVGLDGQSIDLPDGSCDAALSTFTLCTIPDPTKALAEVARVLVPGGQIHLVEHGLAPSAGVARWQHRIDPFEKRLAGGCHLTRDSLAMLADAGFTLVRSEQRFVKGPKPWSFITVAVATRPS
jgi:ubiquinone/menaquinone biosynthesis C-methylase UbiE